MRLIYCKLQTLLKIPKVIIIFKWFGEIFNINHNMIVGNFNTGQIIDINNFHWWTNAIIMCE